MIAADDVLAGNEHLAAGPKNLDLFVLACRDDGLLVRQTFPERLRHPEKQFESCCITGPADGPGGGGSRVKVELFGRVVNGCLAVEIEANQTACIWAATGADAAQTGGAQHLFEGESLVRPILCEGCFVLFAATARQQR